MLYYDPTFHGIDVDARYKTYLERVKKSETLGDAFRTVAAYLSSRRFPFQMLPDVLRHTRVSLPRLVGIFAVQIAVVGGQGIERAPARFLNLILELPV